MEKLRIALAGNPNSGKTSVFNALTGAHQHVGNWGGVTVEIKEGVAHCGDRKITAVDLPGTYSLSAYSLEEQVARDYLVGEKPDAVIDVVDATNLERNLYLTVQLLELGVRPVLALNMWDEVKAKGIQIDLDHLSRLLGVPIVPTVGSKGEGVGELLQKAVECADSPPSSAPKAGIHLPSEIEEAATVLRNDSVLQKIDQYSPSYVALRLLENDAQVVSLVGERDGGKELLTRVESMRQEITRLLGDDPESLVAESRYGFVSGALKECVRQPKRQRVEVSDQVDTVITHPVWAYPIFILFMWLLFQATFVLGEYPKMLLEMLVEWLGGAAMSVIPEGVAQDLLVDGIIRGVGGVVVFLPNILILFFGISIMEDTGYMARAAFIMDKFMHKMGLHGKSFVPALMGLGCNVPAIMAARTLESEQDRIKTILLAPLISCSARLPVYVLFAGAFFPKHVAGNVVFLFQFGLGTLAFFVMGVVFKKTLFRGEEYPFVMELPPYRLPTLRSVSIHMWHKAGHYLRKMGGVVLVFSVILWALGAYPKDLPAMQSFDSQIQKTIDTPLMDREEREAIVSSLRARKASHHVEQSYIGRIGRAVQPLVRPLGLDWRAAVSLITGFVAKELVVSSMGVLYAAGEDSHEESEVLRSRLKQHFTPLSAVSFMLFVLLYTPCVVALVTMVRELPSLKWSVFAVVYQVVLAWLVAFTVYQAGRLVGFA